MRILIRLLALLAAISALSSIWAAGTIAARGMLLTLFRTGGQGIVLIVSWVIGITVGPWAAVQLWRIRESGRLAGIAFFGAGVVLYLSGWMMSGQDYSLLPLLRQTAIFVVPVIILLLPPVRKAFYEKPSVDEMRRQ